MSGSDLFEAFFDKTNKDERADLFVRIPAPFKELFRYVAFKEKRDLTQTILMAAFLLRREYESRGGKIPETISKGMDEYSAVLKKARRSR